jgi:hypothetical protein
MKPQIGWYATVCCVLDLKRIKDEEELAEIASDDELGWRCWPTLDEAIAELRLYQPWGSDEEEATCRLRASAGESR